MNLINSRPARFTDFQDIRIKVEKRPVKLDLILTFANVNF